MSSVSRALALATLAAGIAALYLYNLGGVGMLGPDEPRYAAIGQAMAHSGDYVTPKLWGSAWFEKPPLLYWMTAAATLVHLSPEVSARLPVALLSLVFLAASYVLLRDEFGFEVAASSTAMLATSAGWIAFSDLGLTDLPLAVFFSLAAFLSLPLLRASPATTLMHWRFAAIGVSIAVATLAKGLVPLALAVPFFWFLRSYWRYWWIAFLSCAAAALPWYLAVYLRNGNAFLQEFFVRHHFERLYSPSLQHVQPWYYYFPVVVAALFPWTPLIGLLARRNVQWDLRRRFLAAICVFGFVVFSVSLNKLPGYVLPLLPSFCLLIASPLETRPLARLPRIWLLACALLVAAIPPLARVLPESLITGRFSLVAAANVTRAELFYIAAPILVVFLARRSWVGLLLALCVVSGGIYMKTYAFPRLDRELSARQYAAQIKNLPGTVCDGGMNRDWILGISFYRGSHLAPCATGKFDYAIRSQGHGMPAIEPLKR